MSASWQRILGLMVVSTSLAAGCSSPMKINVGGTCVLNSDCNQGLVCTWGKCHVACNTSADCPAGETCITSSDQSNVCQLPGETYCIYNHDCPTGLICGVDQQCRKQCQVDVDCLYGQICTSAQTCVDPNNNPVVPDAGLSGFGGARDAGGAGGSISPTPDASPDLPVDVPNSTGGVVSAGGTGGGSGSDAALTAGVDAPPGADAATGADSGPANACIDLGATASLCTSNPSLPSVTNLSGTWVLETVGAQVVTTPAFANPFHLKSINVLLAQVVQTGSDITLSASYCDRIQNDDPNNPAKVVLPDAWRLTPAPLVRSGNFADDGTGQLTLTLPTLIEVFGAILSDPACEALPVDANDPRLVDTDGDGFPGITVDLTGLISGTLRSVQRQATALHGVAVAADRVQGGMAYESDQSVVASDPPSTKTLYTGSQSSADPTECSSSFVMVRVPTVADAGAVDCAWVRANEAALLGL